MNSEHDGKTHAERAALACTAGDQARLGQSVTLTGSEAADRRPRVASQKEAFELLAWAAAFDGRERGPYEAAAWAEALHGRPCEAVKDAITEHYRRSRYPVMPANVIEIIEEGAAL
ncbi:hypothetical protein [Leucobacter chironomi]|uniref:hypothetical protein n=1 Tax=Leucobacter chironomi TaxID=491918 RepID=UPI000417AC6F|nr:hypothetical protein [Leucobacter chironomi]